MKDLFQEIYNKVLSLFSSQKVEVDPTKNVAVNRLKTVLMQDRAGFSERAIQMMKEELISTVSKYMEIDCENFELQIDATEDMKTVLNLSIPVIRPKTDDEIDDGIRKIEMETQRRAMEIVKELETLVKANSKAIAEGEITSYIEGSEEETGEENQETDEKSEEVNVEDAKEDEKVDNEQEENESVLEEQ